MADKPKPDEKKVDTSEIAEEVKAKIVEEAVPEIKETLRSEIADDIKQETATIKQEVKDEAVKAAKEDLAKTLTGEPAEEKSPWEKEGRRPRDYKEVADWSKEQTLKEIDVRDAKKKEEADKAVKETKQADKDKEKKWGKYWDEQFKELVEEGKIPGINEDVQRKMDKGQTLTQEEREDPGVRARAEIWDEARKSKESNLRLVYFEHIKGKEDVGVDAPVFGSRRSSKPVLDKADYTYEQTRDDSVEDILTGK